MKDKRREKGEVKKWIWCSDTNFDATLWISVDREGFLMFWNWNQVHFYEKLNCSPEISVYRILGIW